MEEEEYLADPHVLGFIDYFSKIIHGEVEINHQYEVLYKPWQKFLREKYSLTKNDKYILSFKTLEDAFNQYFWPPGGFLENMKLLAKLEQDLLKSINSNDEYKLFYDCVSVLKWGNVLNKGSMIWLHNKLSQGELSKSLKAAVKSVTLGSQEAVSREFGKDGNYLMNSGTTKIFSLCSKSESIIYDGRVGAALGFMVKKYLLSESLQILPSTLNFAWGAEQGKLPETGSRRNPSTNNYQFTQLGYDSSEHANMNLKANWLFDGVMCQCKNSWLNFNKADDQPKRALESALFIVGYTIK